MALSAHAQSALTVHFASPAEGRKILTEGAEAQYYEALQMGDLRAKSKLALQGLSLATARTQVRAKFAEDVQAFSAEEEAMLRSVLERLAPKIAKFPLMARTPFSFVKTGTSVEAGIPHTRGASIVLAPTELNAMLRMYRWGWTSILDQMAGPLLVHEQVHVLQRAYPERFFSLYTSLLGFRRLDTLPDHPWLVAHRVVNPDATDLRWAYGFVDNGKQRWIRSDLMLRVLEEPDMVDDTRTVGIDLIEKDGVFSVAVDEKGLPQMQDLKRIKDYQARFPSPTNSYHPQEICADLIAGWITGNPEGNAKHPLRSKIGTWVLAHFQ